MLSMFRFRRSRGPVEFAVGMSGVRLGERMLHVGPGHPAVFAAAAAKAGLTGRACAVVTTNDAVAALETAAAREGVFVEVACAQAGAWPYDAAAFDVALLDGNLLLAAGAADVEAMLADVQRAVRPGGRVMAIFRSARGLAVRLGFEPSHRSGATADALLALLGRAGFGPARFLAAREGLTFVEAFRPRA